MCCGSVRRLHYFLKDSIENIVDLDVCGSVRRLHCFPKGSIEKIVDLNVCGSVRRLHYFLNDSIEKSIDLNVSYLEIGLTGYLSLRSFIFMKMMSDSS